MVGIAFPRNKLWERFGRWEGKKKQWVAQGQERENAKARAQMTRVLVGLLGVGSLTRVLGFVTARRSFFLIYFRSQFQDMFDSRSWVQLGQSKG